VASIHIRTRTTRISNSNRPAVFKPKPLPGAPKRGRPRHEASAYRSGLEDANAEHMKLHGVPVLFEHFRISYEVPSSIHTYRPDFVIPHSGIIIETKGLWELADRRKHLLIRKQYPKLDIRFVFQNPNNPIYKGSKTTYADFCSEHHIPWAAKVIPVPWLREEGPGIGALRDIPGLLWAPITDEEGGADGL